MLNRLRISLILIILLALQTPTPAQEFTPEPTLEADAPVIEENETPDVIVVETPAGDQNITLPAWQLFAFVVTAFLSGGAISIAGLGLLATKILNNPAALKNAEALGDSVPAETANKAIELATAAIQIATLVKEVFDRIPAESKPQSVEGEAAVG